MRDWEVGTAGVRLDFWSALAAGETYLAGKKAAKKGEKSGIAIVSPYSAGTLDSPKLRPADGLKGQNGGTGRARTVQPQVAQPTAKGAAAERDHGNHQGLPVSCAVIARRASESLRSGHVWVYASDVLELRTGPNESAGILPIVDNRGIPLGTGLYSASSQITLRLVSRGVIGEVEWMALLASRLRTAIGGRRPLWTEETNACRLVFSEADELPGVIVDKYAGVVVVQLLAKGLDTPATRTVCRTVLSEELAELGSLTVWERPDPRIRELEGLSAPAMVPLFATDANAPASETIFRLNGLNFNFSVNSGQKTGAFLDQRENYAAVEGWARKHGVKRALDVCTYQGGFALHLARVCEQVTGIDASRGSLEIAERNLELNQALFSADVDWVEGDAFEILRAWSGSAPESATGAGTGLWDLIVLDPPAFAKSKRAVEGALRGYKELNLRALRMLKPGGLLVSCSCSHHVTWSDLEGSISSAAVDADRRVRLLERRGAALDHPVVMGLAETEYLKCLICLVE